MLNTMDTISRDNTVPTTTTANFITWNNNSSLVTSLITSSLIALLYPASLYIWPNALRNDRHDPVTMKRNFISVALTSTIATGIVYYTVSDSALANYGFYGFRHPYWTWPLWCIVLPLTHAAILFSGPIYLKHCHSVSSSSSSPLSSSCHHDGSQQWRWWWLYTMIRFSIGNILQLIKQAVTDLETARNLLVAPTTEEYIFRCTLLTILLAGGWSTLGAIIISSTLFGAMHTHYYWRECYLSGRILKGQTLTTMLLFAYTTVFGAYAAVIFLAASKQLPAAMLLHSFCNTHGLPDFARIATNRQAMIVTIVGLVVWFCTLIPLIQIVMS